MSDPDPGQQTEPKGDDSAGNTTEESTTNKPSDDVSPPLILSGDGGQGNGMS